MKLLLDTNVLVDLVGDRRPYAEQVKKLCIAKVFGDVQLWVTTQSYMDALYVLSQDASESETRRALLATLEFFLPCSLDIADLKPALESNWRDAEDFMVAFCAKRMHADFVVTRDKEMLERCPIPAVTPQGALDVLEREYGLVYDEVDLCGD